MPSYCEDKCAYWASAACSLGRRPEIRVPRSWEDVRWTNWGHVIPRRCVGVYGHYVYDVLEEIEDSLRGEA